MNRIGQNITLIDWKDNARSQLSKAKVNQDDIEYELDLILQHFTSYSRAIIRFDVAQLTLTHQQQRDVDQALLRRVNREPLSHILGSWEFWGLEFIVNRHVLTPRPDTEVLVEEAVRWLESRSSDLVQPQVIDVGAGTGCVGLSVAHTRPMITLTLIEPSLNARLVCTENIARLRSTGQLSQATKTHLIDGDLLKYWDQSSVDLIVSNPPYISDDELGTLEPEVLQFEPEIALKGGGSAGLELVQRLCRESFQLLNSKGALFMEVGWTQTEQTAAYLAEIGFTHITMRKDYGGNPRVVGGVKP